MSSGDRAALVALFRSTGGTRWNQNDNWDTNANLKQWRGVQVNDDGRVVELDLNNNHLKGSIPEALGALTELKVLELHGNKLMGPIPEALGALKELEVLDLAGNKLMGTIPEALGALTELTVLELYSNELTGPIPEALRALEELTILGLNGNKFTGSIPEWLGSLRKLRLLGLRRNQLTGPIPEALGALKELTHLWLDDNKLTGVIPMELGNLSALSEFEFGSTGLKAFLRRGNRLTGLDSLIRENPGALEDIQRVIGTPVAGSFSADNELSDMQSRRKLGTLVTMSTALGEVVLKHTEDMDVKRKELALPPFSKEYYTAVRTGLCNAYLAASVIDSDWVSTSKTGGMGKAGAALKVMSSAIPVVGGPTGLAGKAMKTGDHYLQTRRLVKITTMAHDAIECCSLARRLALQLADGLRNDAGAGADEVDHIRADITAGMNGAVEKRTAATYGCFG